MNNYFSSGNPVDCCGCTACSNVCPKKCIKLSPNVDGFLYPEKDQEKCVDCGLCMKVCPIANDNNLNTIKPETFAAYDMQNRAGSSSGGIFYLLAKYVIEIKHGWVFGASFADKFQLRHIGVNSISELNKLRGSKYLQSDLGNVFSRVKTLLTEGSFVLFVGTPCQIAGLRCYLRKEYDNLIMADLVCHGVPSQWLFDQHVKYLESKSNSQLIEYSFRDNNAWGGCEIAKFSNGKVIKKPTYELSPYLYSFMYSMTYRESCYECKFATMPRQGDITLADFWGVSEFFPNIDTSKGVSMVMVNTLNGKAIWDSVKSSCFYRESNIVDAYKHNGNLVNKCQRPAIRKDIYNRIRQEGYANIAKTEFKSPRRLRIIIQRTSMYKFAFSVLYPLYKILKK